MRTLTNGMGFLLADDTASGGKKEEADLVGCNHCCKTMRRKLWADDGGFCHCCDRPVCATCADRMLTRGCENFMRQLETALDIDYRRQQNAKVLGL